MFFENKGPPGRPQLGEALGDLGEALGRLPNHVQTRLGSFGRPWGGLGSYGEALGMHWGGLGEALVAL